MIWGCGLGRPPDGEGLPEGDGELLRVTQSLRDWAGLWLLDSVSSWPLTICVKCPQPACATWGSWWLKDVSHVGRLLAPAGME